MTSWDFGQFKAYVKQLSYIREFLLRVSQLFGKYEDHFFIKKKNRLSFYSIPQHSSNLFIRNSKDFNIREFTYASISTSYLLSLQDDDEDDDGLGCVLDLHP